MKPLPRQRKSPSDPPRPGASRRSWLLAGALSVLAHGAILLPILSAQVRAPLVDPPAEPILVELFRPPPPPAPAPAPVPAEDPAPPGPPEPDPPAGPVVPEPPQSPPPPPVRAARRPSPTVAPVPIAAAPPRPSYAMVGGAQLAGAIRAGAGGSGGGGGGGGGGAGGPGSGQGGGACDMVRRLQDALRDDPEVRAAIAMAHREAEAGSRALLVWNGDWIQNPGQEGKGLAGLRQAISVEVAFSPKACQAEPVRGLVLLSLSEGAGAPRVALGQGAWTWADLLDRRR